LSLPGLSPYDPNDGRNIYKDQTGAEFALSSQSFCIKTIPAGPSGDQVEESIHDPRIKMAPGGG
jgi:hypothetical protein